MVHSFYYVKGFVGTGSENKLYIKYLQSKKDQYQDVVQQLENGFNHGRFRCRALTNDITIIYMSKR